VLPVLLSLFSEYTVIFVSLLSIDSTLDRIYHGLIVMKSLQSMLTDVFYFKCYHSSLPGFAKYLLEVGDDFERAIQAAPQKGVAVVDAEAALKTLVEGTSISTACSTALIILLGYCLRSHSSYSFLAFLI
jgi:hypothetical protein